MFTGNSESIQSFHDLMRDRRGGARNADAAAAARWRWRAPLHGERQRGHPRTVGGALPFGAVAAEAAS